MKTVKKKTSQPKDAQSPPRSGEHAKGRVYKTLGLDTFIHKARQVHGDKYDYSGVNYVGSRIKVVITCPKHGPFKMRPTNHLGGQGCPKCGRIRLKPNLLVFGVGINDVTGAKKLKEFAIWKSMLSRCYNPHNKFYRNYHNCSVVKEWHIFSNFKKWWDENQRNGFEMDKDLLSTHDKKEYGPETCCFLPPELNNALKPHKGYYRCGNKFYSRLQHDNVYLGSFSTKEQAFLAYKSAKESLIKARAKNYYAKGEISDKIYKALTDYKVKQK